MAKRTPRSQTDETSAATPTRSSGRTSTSGRAEDSPDARPGEQETAPESSDTFAARGEARDNRPRGASSDAWSEPNESEPSVEEIRFRAYELYVERGGGDGMDFEDWLQAEQELKGKK